MSDGKDSGDNTASDQEASDLDKEYQENQQSIQEQTAELDKMEMGFLHAQSGGRYETPDPNAPRPPPSSPSSSPSSPPSSSPPPLSIN